MFGKNLLLKQFFGILVLVSWYSVFEVRNSTSSRIDVLESAKDSFINLDQDLLKVVKISGQVESTVQDKITQKWIQIFWLYFLPLKI